MLAPKQYNLKQVQTLFKSRCTLKSSTSPWSCLLSLLPEIAVLELFQRQRVTNRLSKDQSNGPSEITGSGRHHAIWTTVSNQMKFSQEHTVVPEWSASRDRCLYLCPFSICRISRHTYSLTWGLCRCRVRAYFVSVKDIFRVLLPARNFAIRAVVKFWCVSEDFVMHVIVLNSVCVVWSGLSGLHLFLASDETDRRSVFWSCWMCLIVWRNTVSGRTGDKEAAGLSVCACTDLCSRLPKPGFGWSAALFWGQISVSKHSACESPKCVSCGAEALVESCG